MLEVSPEEEDLSYLGSLLSEQDYAVKSAASIAEALRILRQEPVCMVFTAENLPDGTWEHFLLVSRRRHLQLPVIVMVRFSQAAHWAFLLSTGAFDVLPRPFSETEVGQVAGLAYRASLQLREFPEGVTVIRAASGLAQPA